jgi:tetratricopeptide (TPR) repeat protein
MLGKDVNSVEDACGLLANLKQSYMIILDNADDPNFDYQVYLPSSVQGVVIMTSRFVDCKQFSTSGWEALINLDQDECRELLLKAAGIPKQHWEAHKEATNNIVHLLGSHTLALIQAGAYVSKGHCSLSDYPRIFQQQRRRLLEFRPAQARSRYCDVYTTFEASAEVLSEDALQLLGIISVLHFSFLSLSIFERAWEGSQLAGCVASVSESGLGDMSSWDVSQPPDLTDMSYNETGIDVLNEWHVARLPSFIGSDNRQWDHYQLNEAIYLLNSLSLITIVEQDGARGISMHPLAHAWAKDRKKTETRGQSWREAGSLLTLSTRGSTSRERVERHLQPHLQSLVDEKLKSDIISGHQRNMLALAWSCCWMLVQMRDDSRLERLLQEVYQEARLDSDSVQPGLVPLYHLLAQSRYFSGHHKMAVDLMEQVVKIRRETLAEIHPSRVLSEHLLAVVYYKSGQIDEARKLLEHIVKIRRKTLSETHPYLLDSQLILATTYLADGRIAEAITMLEHVVQIQERTLTKTHLDQLASQYELARAYQADGRIAEAIILLEYVAKIEETLLSETHPHRLASQHVLATAYLADGRIAEAITILEHVVKIQERTLTKTHLDQLASQHVLATAYQADGRIAEAITMLEYVTKIEETILSETHPHRLASQHVLATAYLADGRIAEAITILEHVVQIQERTLPKTHLDQLASQHELARAYRADGQIAEAITLLEHVVKIKEMTLAETHLSRLVSQHVLAIAYEADGQIAEAIKLLEHVVKIRETTLAETHPSRLRSQRALARALNLLPLPPNCE